MKTLDKRPTIQYIDDISKNLDSIFKTMKTHILIATNSQKVLNSLIEYPIKDFLETEVQKFTQISKSGVNYALRDLVNAGFIFRTKRGRIYFYTLNHKNPIVKQLKVTKTILHIEKFLQKIEKISSKIILFGSSSRGENMPDSDIDLFIISRDKDRIIEKINKFKIKKKVQTIVRSNLKFVEMQKTDPIFYDQVNKGIVLWEGEEI